MAKSEKIGDTVDPRERRAIAVIQARAQGMSWLKAWKVAAPHSKASRKSATDLAKRDFKWYRETHREELEQMLDAFDEDALFVAKGIKDVYENAALRVGTKREVKVKRDKKSGKMIETVTMEEPILVPNAGARLSALTLLTELRGWKGNGAGQEGPSQYIIVVHGKVKKRRPKMRRVGHGSKLSAGSDVRGEEKVQDRPRSQTVRRLRGPGRS